MFGYATVMNFAGFLASVNVADETNNFLMRVGYKANANLTINELNIASIVGKASNSRIDNYVMKNAEDADDDEVTLPVEEEE